MKEEKKVLSVLQGQAISPPPIWLMRQAGRYLPEYQELRAKAGSFWKLAMTPKLAVEITLQPIRRFGFDAAILFSDILVIPAALGIEVEYETGSGPRMHAISSANELVEDEVKWAETLSPVYEAMELTRDALPRETTLIGFAGAPWTLATYLAEGGGSSDQRAAKLWGYRDPLGFNRLLDLLADRVTVHLSSQIRAGADVVQIFDSWASGLPDYAFERWVVAPTKKIVAALRKDHPKTRVIGFPRAATLEGYELYARETGVDAISIGTAAPPRWAAATLGPFVAVQGNVDPIALIAGGTALAEAVERILSAMSGVPHILNLGHGILPETPIRHVEELIARVRSHR